MEPTLTTAQTLTVAAFSLGVTQWVKDLGVQGQSLKLVCLAAGLVAWVLTTFYPDAWGQLSALLIALSTTGAVSFVDERLDKMKKPS